MPKHPRHDSLKKALQNKAKTYEYKTNPILKMVPPKPKAPTPKPQEVQIRTVKRGRMRQYGDSGYVPSTGEGVGH